MVCDYDSGLRIRLVFNHDVMGVAIFHEQFLVPEGWSEISSTSHGPLGEADGLDFAGHHIWFGSNSDEDFVGQADVPHILFGFGGHDTLTGQA